MLSIAYVSVATSPMSGDDIAAILLKSRANNRREALTGALLYHRERFVQIVEGPADVVRHRLAIIAADPRHRDILVLREEQIEVRQFPEWTMGFGEGDSVTGTHLPGYEDIFGRRGAERLKHANNDAQQFLESLGEFWLQRVR